MKILIAEDMHLLRRALVSLLELEDDIEVVGEVSSAAEIVPRALETKPDVAVLDIDLAGMDGIHAAAQLHALLPSCRTLILTVLGRPGDIRRAVEAHASGFLLKDQDPAALVTAIRAVANGERIIDSQLAIAALEHGDNPLTERERQVLQLAAEGEEVPQIARKLFLAPGTVRNYMTAIVDKLNARNRVDAIRIAREFGWL